ncbi:plasmid partitioning protein RepB [Brucella ciceri]|uniref:plasmid partitioning protein RepB n=1 Tax=Brucella TaxID=234 RepID=UPI001F134771|nr:MULTISPECIES: plasmid partitioning protein RepB [Brucella]MCH6206287.1 plasmid partitioning protein RepB [Brucella ciceri]WPM83002.1 plasmid partitioning protein RepB [Brucella pseudintermedia]
MKKSILKQMADVEARGGEGADKPILNPMAARRHSSPVISNVGRALTQLTEDSIVTLDATKIERSPFKDRFDADQEAADELEALKVSIASEGQKIPVLVRPHPTRTGLYQLAYGYRRLAAIKALNEEDGRAEPIKVKAYVRELSDRQLIEEQSVENGVREGLTWIEQAMWTVQLKAVGMSQRAICPILGLTESAISHFGKVTSVIPEDVIYAIGRAKSVGRPKWTSLAELMDGKTDIALKLVKTPEFQAADTPARFDMLFDALKDKKPSEAKANSAPAAKSWTSNDNSVSFMMNRKPKKVAIELTSTKAAPFGDWLSNRLDALYEEFRQSENERTGD